MAPITDLSDISGDERVAKPRQKSLDTILKQLSTNTYHDSVKSESTSSPFVKSLGGRSDTSTTKPEDELDSATDQVKRTRRVKKRRNFSRRPKLFPTETSSTDISEGEDLLLHFSDKGIRSHFPLTPGTTCMSVNDSDTTPLCKTDSKSIKGYDSVPLDDVTTESELIPIGDHSSSPAKVHSQKKDLLSHKVKDREKTEFTSKYDKNVSTKVHTSEEKMALFDECVVVEEREDDVQQPYHTREDDKSTGENCSLNSVANPNSGSLNVREILQRANESYNIRVINFMQNRRDDVGSKHFARKSLDYLSTGNGLLDTKDAETLTARRSVPRLPKREGSKDRNDKKTSVTMIGREENLDNKRSVQGQVLCRHSQQRLAETRDAETLTSKRSAHKGDEITKTKQIITPVAIGNAGDGLDKKSVPQFPIKSRRSCSPENKSTETKHSDSIAPRRSPTKIQKRDGCGKGLRNGSKMEFSKDFPAEDGREDVADQIPGLSLPKSRRSIPPNYTHGDTSNVSNLSASRSVPKLSEEKSRFVYKSPKNNYFQEVNGNMEENRTSQSKQKAHINISTDNLLSRTKVLSQDALGLVTCSRSDSKQGYLKTKYVQDGVESFVRDPENLIKPRSRQRSRNSTQQRENNKSIDLDVRFESSNSKESVAKLCKEEDVCQGRVGVHSSESKYFDAMSRVIERNLREINQEDTDEDLSSFAWRFFGRGSSPEEAFTTDLEDSEALSTSTSISRLLDDLLEREQSMQRGNRYAPALRVSDVIEKRFGVGKSQENLHGEKRLPGPGSNRSIYASVKEDEEEEMRLQTFLKPDEIPFVEAATLEFEIEGKDIVQHSQQTPHRYESSDQRSMGNLVSELVSIDTSVTKLTKRERSRHSIESIPSKNVQPQVSDVTKTSFVEKIGPRRKPSGSSSDKNSYDPENMTDRTSTRNPLNFEEKGASPKKESLRGKAMRQLSKKIHVNQRDFSDGVDSKKKSKTAAYDTVLFVETSSPGSKMSPRGRVKKLRRSDAANDMKYSKEIESDANALRRSVRNLLKDAESVHSIRDLISKSRGSLRTESAPDRAIPVFIGYVSEENLDRISQRNSRCSDGNEAYSTKLRRSTPCLWKEGESEKNKKSSSKPKYILETSPVVVGGKIGCVPPRKSVVTGNRTTEMVPDTRAVLHGRSAPRLVKEGDSGGSFKEVTTKTKPFYEAPGCVKQTTEGANEPKTRPSLKRARRIKAETGDANPSSRKTTRQNVKEYSVKSNNSHDFSIILQTSPVAEDAKERNVRSVSRKSQRNKQPETIILDASDFDGVSIKKSIPCILIEGETRRNVKAYITKSKHIREQSPGTELWSAEAEGRSDKARRIRRHRASDHVLEVGKSSDTVGGGPAPKAQTLRVSRDIADSRFDFTSKSRGLPHEVSSANSDSRDRSSRRKSTGTARSIPLESRFSDTRNDMGANRFRLIPRLTKDVKSREMAESSKHRIAKEKTVKGEEEGIQKSRKKLSLSDSHKRVGVETDKSVTGNRNKKSLSIVMDILKSVLSNTSNMGDDDNGELPEAKGDKNASHRKAPGGKKQSTTATAGVDSRGSSLRTVPKVVERLRSVRDDNSKAATRSVDQTNAPVDKNSSRSRRKSRGSRRPASSSDNQYTDYNDSDFLKN